MEPDTQTQQPTKPVDSKLHPLGIVVHAFSPDFTMIAASIKEENVVNIYKVGDLESPSKWQLVQTLKEHSQTVSVLDWSSTNLIVTGSFDRSIFVWSYNKEQQKFEPNMVMGNKQNRGILDGSWSPNGRKFCYSTGTYKVFQGFFDPATNWWDAGVVSQKKFSSSVLCVSYHPSNRVIAAGSSDFSVRLYTAYVEDADRTDGYKGVYDDVKTSGEELYRIKNAGCWVNTINWAPNGLWAAVVVHNSSVTILKYVPEDKTYVEAEDAVVWDKLPFKSVVFVNNDSFVAGGYDNDPVKFKVGGNKGEMEKVYLRDKKKDAGLAKSQVKSNLSIFESGKLAKQGSADSEFERHTNPILCMRAFKRNQGTLSVFSSNDIHGNLFFWTA